MKLLSTIIALFICNHLLAQLATEPTTNPRDFVLDKVSANGAQFHFTPNSFQRPDGHLVVVYPIGKSRRSGQDGLTYVAGDTIDLLQQNVVVYSGEDTSITISQGLSINTGYYIYVYPFNGSGESTNYAFNRYVWGTIYTDPASQPTEITLNYNTGIYTEIKITNPDPTPSGVIVLRRGTDVNPVAPIDFDRYLAGRFYESQQIVYAGGINSTGTTIINDAWNITMGQTYVYDVYSYMGNNLSSNYLQESPLSGSIETVVLKPTEQATGIVTNYNPSGNYVDVNIEKGNTYGNLIVRRYDTTVVTHPVDGVFYISNQDLGNQKVITSFTGTFVRDLNIPAPGRIIYEVYTYNGNSQRLYLTEKPLRDTVEISLSEEPTLRPTELQLSYKSGSYVELNFEKPNRAPTGYLIMRRESDVQRVPPKDGNIYTIGQAYEGQIVLTTTASGSFNDNRQLEDGVTYVYDIYPYNGGHVQVNYLTDNPLSGSIKIEVPEPTSPANNVEVTYTNGQTFSRINIENPSEPPVGYLVLRRRDTAKSVEPLDGVRMFVGNEYEGQKVVSFGTSRIFNDNRGFDQGLGQYVYETYAYNGTIFKPNFLTSTFSRDTIEISLFDEPEVQASFVTAVYNGFSVVVTAIPQNDLNNFIAFRREDTVQRTPPQDGVTYSFRQNYESQVALDFFNTQSISDNYLLSSSQGKTFVYDVYTYQGEGMFRNYRQVDPIMDTVKIGVADEPNSQPTNLVISYTGNTTVRFSRSDADQYMVILRDTSVIPFEPVDATFYNVNTNVGENRRIAYIGPYQEEIFINSLYARFGRHYAFDVYGFNGSGSASNFLSANPLSDTLTIAFRKPTGGIRDFKLKYIEAGNDHVQLSFKKPDVPVTGYMIFRRTPDITRTPPIDGRSNYFGSYEGQTLVTSSGFGNQDSIGFNDFNGDKGNVWIYDAYLYNGTGSQIRFNQTPVSDTIDTNTALAIEPTAFAQDLKVEYEELGGDDLFVNVSFDVPNEKPDYFLITMRQKSQPQFKPVDRVFYNLNHLFDGGQRVVYKVFSGNQDSVILNREIRINQNQRNDTLVIDVYSYNGDNDQSAINYLTANHASQTVLTIAGFADEPTAQPTNLNLGFNFVNTTNYQVNGSFLLANPRPDGYLVVKRRDDKPRVAPRDSTEYSVGESYGGQTIVSSFGGRTFTDRRQFGVGDLELNQTLVYDVYAYNGFGKGRNYLTNNPLTDTVRTFFNTPDTIPSNLMLNFSTTATPRVTFSYQENSVEDWYVVLRRTSEVKATAPVDGQTYTPGQDYNGQKVVAVVSGSNGIDINVPLNTTLRYDVYSFKGRAELSKYSKTALSSSILTSFELPNEPTSRPKNLKLNFGLTNNAPQVEVRFERSEDANGYLITRREAGTNLWLPEDSTFYSFATTLEGNTVVYSGSSLTFLDRGASGLLSNKKYIYAVFPFSGSGSTLNYLVSNPLQDTVKTAIEKPVAQPTELTLTFNPDNLDVSIRFRASEDADGYIVLRREPNVSQTPPMDGTTYLNGQLYQGQAVIGQDSRILFTDNRADTEKDKTYVYDIYAYNGQGLNRVYLAENPLSGSISTEIVIADQPVNQPINIEVGFDQGDFVEVKFEGLVFVENYIALRRTRQITPVPPIDGAFYDNNQTYAGQKVVFVGKPNAITQVARFSDFSFERDTEYIYEIYGFNGSGVVSNYLETSPLSDTIITTIFEPKEQPKNLTLQFNYGHEDRANVSFAPSDAYGHLIVRRDSGSVVTTPTDGVVYSLGNVLGEGQTIVQVGVKTAFEDRGLDINKKYIYDVYAYNGTGQFINYLIEDPLSDTLNTEIIPALQPTEVSVNGEVEITFQNNTNNVVGSFETPASRPDGFIVVEREANIERVAPQDGQVYNQGGVLTQGHKVVYNFNVGNFFYYLPQIGFGGSIIGFGLEPGKTYAYDIYSYNGVRSDITYIKEPITKTVKVEVVEPQKQPKNLRIEGRSETSLALFVDIDEADPPYGILVLRRSSSTPRVSPQDGQFLNAQTTYQGQNILYNGGYNPFLGVVDNGVELNSTYFYDIYAYNGLGNYVNYKNDNPLSGSILLKTNQPKNMTLVYDEPDTLVRGSYEPAKDPVDGYIVVRKKASENNFWTRNPENGREYQVGDKLNSFFSSAVVISVGSGLSFFDEDIILGNRYQYQVFSYNGTGEDIEYQTILPLTGVLTAGKPLPPKDINVQFNFGGTRSNNSISIVESPSDPTGYLIFRRDLEIGPTLPIDGVEYRNDYEGQVFVPIASGSSRRAVDADIFFNQVYVYDVYSFNGDGIERVYSDPVFDTVITDPTYEVLKQIYARTDGSNWLNSENWLDRNVSYSDWFGVTIGSNNEIHVELPNNNLRGVISENITLSEDLKILDLSDNRIYRLPDFSRSSIEVLDLSRNLLNFDDIVPNLVLGDKFDYSDQKTKIQIVLQRDEDKKVDYRDTDFAMFRLNELDVDSGYLHYARHINDQIVWMRNGVDFDTTEVGEIFFGDSLTIQDKGVYTVRVINGNLPSLTFTSGPDTLLPVGSIKGNVLIDNNIAVRNGIVELYETDSLFVPFNSDSASTTIPIRRDGSFSFEKLELGYYYILSRPDSIQDGFSLANTIYDGVTDNEDATIFALDKSYEEVRFNVISYESAIGTGDKDLSGQFVNESSSLRLSSSNLRLLDVLARRRVRGVGVALRRARLAGRTLASLQTNAKWELVAFTETDDNGNFSFPKLPDGKYRINFQYPGVPMDTTSFVEFSITEEDNDGRVELTAEVTEDGIRVNIAPDLPDPDLKVTGVGSSEVLVYPNPVKDELYISGRWTFSNLELRLVSLMTGQNLEVRVMRAEDQTVILDMRNYNPGIYLLEMSSDDKRIQIRVVKQ